MQNTCTDNSQLPFKCRMVCVSLIGGSMTLVFIFLIYYMGYISIEAALWVSMGAFIILAIYESFLLSLIARHMIKEINKT
jgi:hypothetical protein